MRAGGNTFYLLNDHLTSTAITTNSSGVRQTELRYFAYGGTRYDAGGQLTIYRYTGQRVETGTGLYDYGARGYDPYLLLTKPKGPIHGASARQDARSHQRS